MQNLVDTRFTKESTMAMARPLDKGIQATGHNTAANVRVSQSRHRLIDNASGLPTSAVRMIAQRIILSVAALATIVGQSMPAWAQDSTKIEVILKDHVYQPAELRVPAGRPIVITIENQDATAEEFDSSALKVEKFIPGNSSATARVRPLAAGRYRSIGEQHEDTAKVVLVAE
jgi:plastocyanin